MRFVFLLLFCASAFAAEPPYQRNIFTTNTDPYIVGTGSATVTSNRANGRWTINVTAGAANAITNVSDAANAGTSLIYTSNNFTILLKTLTAGANIWITNNGTNIVIAGQSTNGFVTQTITNGLATISYVNGATNGLVTASVTNGLATISYVDTSLNAASNALRGTIVSSQLWTNKSGIVDLVDPISNKVRMTNSVLVFRSNESLPIATIQAGADSGVEILNSFGERKFEVNDEGNLILARDGTTPIIPSLTTAGIIAIDSDPKLYTALPETGVGAATNNNGFFGWFDGYVDANFATNKVRVAPGAGTSITTNYTDGGVTYVVADTEVSSPMVLTNFVINQVYTNTSTQPILVIASVYLIPALANGDCSIDLMYSKTGGTGYALLSRVAINTLLTGGITLPITNTICGVMTNLGSYYFTNTSSGIGNSAGLVGAGTGQYTVMGGGAKGDTGAQGGFGFSLQETNFGGTVGSATNLVLLVTTNLTITGTNTANGGGTNSAGFDTIQPITTTASVMFGNLTNNGAFTNAGVVNFGSSLSVYGTQTNRSTTRNMGGVTNDVQTVTVGAVENRSSVTNTGPVMNGGAATNFSTTRNIGGVTNDANTVTTGAVENRSSITNTGPTLNGGNVTNFLTTRNIGGVTNDANTLTTGAVENRSTLTNTSDVTLGASLSVYGAQTNRSTTRNMGSVTNDSTLITVGAVQNQSTLTNTSDVTFGASLSVYGAQTNRSTTRNMGGVTNDANVVTVGAAESRSTTTNTGTADFGGAHTIYGAGSTTTTPGTIKLGGGHNTNALSIFQGPAIVGGNNSNGLAFGTISNAAVQATAQYTYYSQTTDGTSCTNITTSSTSVLGTGQGSLTLPAGFWHVGRQVRLEWSGKMWTSSSPGNTQFFAKLGTTTVCTNFLVTLTASAPPGQWDGWLTFKCKTNSATVGAIQVSGEILQSYAGSTVVRPFVPALTIMDTTVSMALDLQATNAVTTTSLQTQDVMSFWRPGPAEL